VPLNGADECEKIEAAFKKAIGICGSDATNILLFHLEERYRIRIGSAPCALLEEINAALFDITGVGADLIIARMRSFMQ
jgi:hypothetical protein